MKNIIKKGELKLVKFKCDFCGTEWESDEFVIDDLRAVITKCIRDNCPVCGRSNRQT